MKDFLLEILSCVSRLLNVLTGSTADITLSARAYRDDLWIEGVINWFARVLFREIDHCERWWDREVARSRANIEWDEAQ